MNGFEGSMDPNLYPKTATLYSAVLDDGDYHSKTDRFTSLLLGWFTPFPEKMRINRAFGKFMYQQYARDGFANVLDIGAGPMPKGHEWAPGRRYLYLDHNPDIVEHARKKLNPSDTALYETGGVGDIPALFDSGLGERAFNGERKIAIASNAVLMFVPDEQIREAFTYLYKWCAPGSVATMTIIGVTANKPTLRSKLIGSVFRGIGAPAYLRNINSFESLFAPWSIVRGPLPTWHWLRWPPSKNTAGIGFDLYAVQIMKSGMC
jgi:S-adenosyl methyltransferase